MFSERSRAPYSRRSRMTLSSLPQGLVSLLVLTLAYSSCTSAATFDCKFEVQGKAFDLSALDKVASHTVTVETPPSTLKETYTLNPCSSLPRDSNLQDHDQCPDGSRACLSIVNQKESEPDRIVQVVPISTGELDPKTSFTAAAKGKPSMLQVELHGGQYANRPRWANLTLFCDPSKDDTDPISWNFRRTLEEGVLSVEWVTKYACPLDSKGSPNPDDGGARTGTSIAGLLGDFVLLLLFLLVLYFAAGAYHQYSRYGSRGWDLIPNRAFWSDLPYVLRDLFRSTGRGSSGYSAL